MKFTSYPRYKDSGIDWLGNVPEHWRVKKFKYLFKPSDERNGDSIVGEMLSVSGYRGIVIKAYEDENQKRTEENLRDYRVVRPGQLVVNTMWLNYAGLGVSRYEGHVSPAYRAYYISEEINGWFAHHLLRSSVYVSGYTKYLQGIRPNSLQIKTDEFHCFPVLLPPAEEQSAIACFLDKETFKIDALIAKQERLIELLKEKRQSIISQDVIKGLNPDVPMRESGIEWLGKIPAHWKVKRLKHVLSWIEQGWSPECEARLAGENEWGVLKSGCVNHGTFNENEHKTLPLTIDPAREYEVKVGDVLMSRASGSPDLVGSAAFVYKCRNQLLLSDKTFRLHRKRSAIDGQYLSAILNSTGVRTQIKQSISGAEGLANNITQGTIKNLVFALPPLEEQSLIVNSIRYTCTRLDSLIEKANSAIEFLKEHRSVLISAAVTGKIDVRQNSNGNLSNH